VKVAFRQSFAKDLKGVKDRGLLNRVKELIEVIEAADSLADVSNLKKLKGGSNYFRLRVGDYRVGITLDHDMVIFVRCLNRKDIYKYFP
jgi:mRNA interferase RelE/StbE